jgi:hypothetical protein
MSRIGNGKILLPDRLTESVTHGGSVKSDPAWAVTTDNTAANYWLGSYGRIRDRVIAFTCARIVSADSFVIVRSPIDELTPTLDTTPWSLTSPIFR